MTGALTVYAGLFASALLAATIFPAQSELLLAYLLRADEHPWKVLLIVATAGNVIGSVINWGLGRWIEHFRDRRWFPLSIEKLNRAERWYLRWGKWSLLGSWLPIVGDPLTLVAGVLRVPLATFLALVTVAKAGRYLAIAAVVAGVSG